MTKPRVDDLLQLAPELSLAPSVLVSVDKLPGDRKTNARSAARSIGAASTHKAMALYQDEHGPHMLASVMRFLIGHSFARRQVIGVTRASTDRAVIPGAVTPPPPRQTTAQVLGAVAVGTQGGGQVLNAGLNEVHHQYRALRDIQQTHGTAAALTEALLIGGAGAVGSLIGPGGTALGAEAAAGITERSLFKDSWERTANGEGYRDASGEKVSIGRDLAHYVFRLKDGSLPYNVTSGLLDGTANLALDPIAQAAAGVRGFNATERAASGLIGKIRGDTVIRYGAEDLDSIIARRPDIAHVFADIARKTAGDIARDYPVYSGIAADLGEASTPEAVANVIREAVTMGQMRGETIPVLVKRTGLGVRPPLTDPAVNPNEPDVVLGRLQRFERRIRTKLPSRYDPESRTFTHVEIDPASNRASDLMAVRNSMKMSDLSDRVIDGLMNQYVNAETTAERRLILRNTYIRGFISRVHGYDPGGDEDVLNQLTRELHTEVTHQMGGTGGLEGAEYAYNNAGESLSAVTLGDGRTTTAAVYTGQRGLLRLPEYGAWVRAAREEAGGVKALYGRMNDFAFRHITVPFKGLALATGGFALRVGGLAEGLPAAFREGVVNLARSAVTAKNAKYAYKFASSFEEEEAGQVAETVLNLLHDGNHVVMNPRLAKDAVELTVANDGHIVPPAMRAGHFDSDPSISKVARDRANIYRLGQDGPRTMRETDQFTGIRGENADFPKYWGRALKEASRDEGARIHAGAYAQAYRDAQSAGMTSPDALERVATTAAIRADEAWLRAPEQADLVSDMVRSRVGAEPGEDAIRSWARTRVEATKGLTHAPTIKTQLGVVVKQAEPHLDLLDAVAAGKVPTYDTLAAVDDIAKPLVVKGRVRVDDRGGNWIQRATDFGFRKMVDPIINTLGREHQYLLEYSRVRRAFDSAIDEGLLSEDEAVQKAQEIAVGRVARFIHNPHERTQVSTLLQNYAPFYFAQEQSYRRLGRMLATDPAAFRRYQLANLGVTDWISRQKDASGRDHLVIPALGVLDEGGVNLLGRLGLPIAQAAPTAILGNVSSLDSVLPFNEFTPEGARPSWAPFVTIPARAIEALMPEAIGDVKPRDVVGDAIGDQAQSTPIWQMLIPNTALRNAAKSFDPRSVDSASVAIIQSLQYRQNVAMSKWVANGGDPASPDAPHIVPPASTDPNTTDGARVLKEFRERVRNQARVTLMFKAITSEFSPLAPNADIGDYKIKKGMSDYVKKYGLIEGPQRYLEKHPDATPYTVFETQVHGVPVQPYRAAQDFLDANKALFKKYPAAAAYMIPQTKDGKFDLAVWQEQLALGIRERKSYDKFVQDLYVNEGFANYDTDQKIHEQALADAAGNDDAVKAENEAWRSYVSGDLAKQNPVWWNYFTSQDRANRRKNELDDLRKLVVDPTTPNTSLKRGIRGLLSDADAHLQALEEGKNSRWSSDERQAEIDSWQSYLSSIAEKEPELQMVISRLFKYVGNR